MKTTLAPKTKALARGFDVQVANILKSTCSICYARFEGMGFGVVLVEGAFLP